MRYIGNKLNLLNFVHSAISKNDIKKGKLCDIFSGTTNVAKYFKRKGWEIISNDIMNFSYVFQRAYIQNNDDPKFKGLSKLIPKPDIFKVVDYLNNLDGKDGFVFSNFCIEGSRKSRFQRNYFSSDNAKKIDAIRDQIEEWHKNELIDDDEFYILLASLLEAVPFVSNIAGTYGAFLKTNDARMSKPIILEVPSLIDGNGKHHSYNEDGNKLVRNISCDVLYIDPPYNKRQYAPNYHLLETIAVWDKKITDSKTGLRKYDHQKSEYCYPKRCIKAFEDLIANARCKYILLSYNTEGIMPKKEIIRVLSNKGKVRLYEQEYRRYKSNSNGQKSKHELKELLFFCEVS